MLIKFHDYQIDIVLARMLLKCVIINLAQGVYQ